jgi:hypothetical protein
MMKTKAKIATRKMSDREAYLDAERRHPGKCDWLAAAIARIGKCGKPGIRGIDVTHVAAAELGMSWQKVIAILEHGAGILMFMQVADLAERAEIPIELLRVGALPSESTSEIAISRGARRVGRSDHVLKERMESNGQDRP